VNFVVLLRRQRHQVFARPANEDELVCAGRRTVVGGNDQTVFSINRAFLLPKGPLRGSRTGTTMGLFGPCLHEPPLITTWLPVSTPKSDFFRSHSPAGPKMEPSWARTPISITLTAPYHPPASPSARRRLRQRTRSEARASPPQGHRPSRCGCAPAKSLCGCRNEPQRALSL